MSRRPRRADHYSRRARQQNYPARSVFKLEEIDRKYRLFRSGQAVLDLGCAPGSWLLFAAQRVGPQGIAVGVDQHSLKVRLPTNARYLKLDALTLEPETLAEVHPSPFDLVLSDMAPHTSGHRFVDQKRSFNLFCKAFALATRLGRQGSCFLGKLFHSDDLSEARRNAEAWYEQVRVVRPQATRKQSYEVYLLCQRRRRAGPQLASSAEPPDAGGQPTDRLHPPGGSGSGHESDPGGCESGG